MTASKQAQALAAVVLLVTCSQTHGQVRGSVNDRPIIGYVLLVRKYMSLARKTYFRPNFGIVSSHSLRRWLERLNI